MWTTAFLSTLLMLRALAGEAASDLQVNGKSIQSDKSLNSNSGRHAERKQPHQQTKSGIRRSLALESFNLYTTPTTYKSNQPTIIKMYPPTAKPLHLHANMPMRFGRDSTTGDDRAPNSSPNMPQRFGRSWQMIQMCAECPAVQQAVEIPQRRGRNSLFWSLLRTLANAEVSSTGLHWAEDFDFTTISEEVEMQE